LRTDRRRLLAATLASAFLALPLAGYGQSSGKEPPAGNPLVDPWVPPAVRAKAAAEPYVATEGEALRAQVRAKLKRRFDAAAGADGTLTAGGARAAGLGAIARDFAAIDRAGRGAVRFEDYERFLDAQR